ACRADTACVGSGPPAELWISNRRGEVAADNGTAERVLLRRKVRHRLIGSDRRVAGHAGRPAEFELFDARETLHERLFADTPTNGCRREEAPLLIRAESR